MPAQPPLCEELQVQFSSKSQAQESGSNQSAVMSITVAGKESSFRSNNCIFFKPGNTVS